MHIYRIVLANSDYVIIIIHVKLCGDQTDLEERLLKLRLVDLAAFIGVNRLEKFFKFHFELITELELGLFAKKLRKE